jgi:hypothetical protein
MTQYTSFNSDPSIRTGALEERFGSVGSANTFYGIPHSSVVVPRDPDDRIVRAIPRVRSPGRSR